MSNVARHVCVAALLLLVTAAAVRDVLFLGRFALEVPFNKYLTLANDVVAGHLPADRMNDVSPLYLWCVSAARAIRLGPPALSWLQALATLAAALFAALTARRLAGNIAALAAALAMLASRTVVLNASELEPEALIVLLNALAIWLLLGRERPSPFLGGIAAAASVMTRPTAILALIVLGVFAARDRWLRFVAGAAIPIVVILGVNVAITHQPMVMNGGTVFYEGMNPHASGYAGVRPAVIDDLVGSDASIASEPDPLHVAFRKVVSRIHHDDATPDETNRYWTGKALAFAREFPGAAARLTLRKLFFAVHGYEAWDVRRTEERSAIVGPVWLPFGVLFALSLIVLADRRTVALAGIVAVYLCAMAIFFVTSRQRDALMPAIAILAGVAITQLNVKRGLVAAAVAVLLTYDWAPQREQKYFEHEKLIVNYGRIGDPALLTTYPVAFDRDLPIAQPAAVREVSLRELAHADSDARRFDIAHGLLVAGEWDMADRILHPLENDGYQPWRGLATVSSVAFYRSIALLHLHRPAEARAELLRAQREAPADDSVLALTAVALGDRNSARRLFTIYDPFTARLAIVRGFMVLRRLPEALNAANALAHDLPEWQRATLIASELRDFASSR